MHEFVDEAVVIQNEGLLIDESQIKEFSVFLYVMLQQELFSLIQKVIQDIQPVRSAQFVVNGTVELYFWIPIRHFERTPLLG